MTVFAKIRDGAVSIPVPLRQKYKMWEGTLMEFVLLDNGILLKPKVEKKEKSEMIDKYISRDQALEDRIISLLSELKSRQKNELIIEEKCPR